MQELIYQIIVLSCLGTLSVIAEPIILLKRQLGFKQENVGKLTCKNTLMNPVRDFFTKLLYCSICSTFWIVVIVTLDPGMACICAILAGILEKQL